MNENSNVFVTAKLFQHLVCNGAIQMPGNHSLYSKLMHQYENATVTLNFDGGLSIYMEDSWKRIKDSISPTPAIGRDMMKLQRLLLGHCEQVIWEQESLRFSLSLLESIGVDNDEAPVFILLFERKIEIWNPVDFNKEVTFKSNDISGEILFREKTSFEPDSYKINFWPPAILE